MSEAKKNILYYIYDPMCSWCWGYDATWRAIKEALPSDIVVETVLGGLAPDTDEPMPREVQGYVQENWRRIQQVIPGVEFNYQFWSNCQPRRSTYPACRAVLAAQKQGNDAATKMTQAIQRAYYLDAKNPSDDAVLIALATSLSLNAERFERDLNSEKIQKELESHIQFYHQLSAAAGVSGFPSLVLKLNKQFFAVPRDYIDPNATLSFIQACLSRVSE